MNDPLCIRENELLEALSRGFLSADLRTHVASCASCSELEMLAGALLEDRAAAVADAPVPAAGTMWWRMRVRHRQEMQAAARRTLLIGQAITLVIALTLIGALFGDAVVAGVRQMFAAARTTPLLLALAASLLTVPLVAGWVAVRQK